MKIKFKESKGFNGIQGIIPFELADKLNLEPGDEIDFKLVAGELFLFRLNPLGHRAGNGFKISKHGNAKGYSIFSSKLSNYIQSGDKFEVDEEYQWDDLNGVELYHMDKIFEEVAQ